MREWKPGDVAMSSSGRVLRCEFAFNGGPGWVYDDGSGQPDNDPGRIRPLAVIDPDSSDDLDNLCKALVKAMHRAGDVASAANGVYPATVAAALREFANPKPPKPEMPSGIGAVVEDDNGGIWVQTLHEWSHGAWCKSGGGDTFRTWAEFNAVRILSPGYTEGAS